MLWFTIWAVLVVGTLVGAFFLLRSVYRAGKGFLAELERATATLDLLAERAEEIAAAGQAGSEPEPVDLLDPEPARARLDAARAARLVRRIRRADRHAATFRSWEAFTH